MQTKAVQKAPADNLGRIDLPGRVSITELNHANGSGGTHAYRREGVRIDATLGKSGRQIRKRFEIGHSLDIIPTCLRINIRVGVLHSIGNHSHDGHSENYQAKHNGAETGTKTAVQGISRGQAG